MAADILQRFANLSEEARQLLRAGQPAEPPIRSELFGIQRFEAHGRSLARAQPVADPAARPREPLFFPRVDENIASLREAFDYIALTSRSGRYVSPAAEWLLDNFHLIEAQLQQIREGVPRSYYAHLPKLAAPPLAGLPRVYGIAWAYVAHTDSVLNAELFTAFLNAYQEVDELTLGELWAFPTTLRVVLLENLRRVAEGIARDKVAREVAHAVWDAADTLTTAELDALGELARRHELNDSYLLQLWQRLPVERGDKAPALVRWTEAHCPNGPALIDDAQTAAVAANITVGNIITTLRMIGQVAWADLIEPVSRSLRVLRELPSFGRESELTRQQITHAMEQVARQSGRSELRVAQVVVRRARMEYAGRAVELPGIDPDARVERTAGFHLLGPGRAALLEALRDRDAQPSLDASDWQLPFHAWRLPLYLLAILGTTALLMVLVAHHLVLDDWPAAGSAGWLTSLCLLLMSLPVSESVIALVHRIVAESARIEPLPRLDFATGIPPGHRVLVVIPALLTSHESNARLVRQLELHWLANRDEEAQFALLTDWADADQESLPEDASLLRDARQRIAALNARHPRKPERLARFLLLHRPRVWSDTERRWMGWERKRGKLEMVLRLLATGDASGFLPETNGALLAARIPYLVTLDADTGLPPCVLRELVAVAAHPMNAPQIDPRLRRVVAGYGILQPRIVTPFPKRAERSLFHWLFAGRCGIDPYSSGTSDIYQDLFGSGSFTGKGLLHVQAVHAVLDRRLPDGAVLSHDLLEGTVARCALLSDLVLLEGHPHHAGVAAARVHRWTRGDWQLLPLMLRPGRFGIDGLGAWKMTDNLRRAMVMPASAALLGLSVFTDAVPGRAGAGGRGRGPRPGPLAGRARRAGADAAAHRDAALFRCGLGRPAAFAGRRGVAGEPVVRTSLAAAGCHAARCLATGGQPAPPARMDHGRPGPGAGALQRRRLSARRGLA